MNRAEVETIVFRIGVAFPGYRGDAVEQRARVEEWLDSPVAHYSLPVALAALAECKEHMDRAPSIKQFTEACRRALRAMQPERALPAADDGPVTSRDDALAQLDGIRDALKTVPADERPARPFRGALIHETTR